jgi:hypothetical protein
VIIYDAPAGSYGYEYKTNSRLLVVNPDDPGAGCAGCTTEYWVLDELGKKFVQVHQALFLKERKKCKKSAANLSGTAALYEFKNSNPKTYKPKWLTTAEEQ